MVGITVIRLEFSSMKEVLHLYQSAMAGKFEGRDKSLLLNTHLNSALQHLIDQLIADAQKQEQEQLAEAMLDGLVMRQDYPQYEAIIDAFSTHHVALNWLSLSLESQQAYLQTAAKPLSISEAIEANLLAEINTRIETLDQQ